MQIDFGDTKVWIGGELVRLHLFVGRNGCTFVRHSDSARHRFEGWRALSSAFVAFQRKFLLDNAKALAEHHGAVTREVRLNARLHAFARYWGFTPRACAPYRARTKGKDERGVGYVKKNSIAGSRFECCACLKRAWIVGRGR